ncbi:MULTISPECIES: hypothetical protein [Pseudomonas]|uniref:hypothetical protein n=1 Tax=Pseudomonas TaxID=286 RepID=UPI0003B94641|nr:MULTISPECIES: hypothetical protein [Pseudomonas]AXS74051.1 hypothetical protein CTT40_05499 [Pseudomonas aeruginosa]EKV2942931.1 hypothetical protein [Pseudomonas aeruginosa]ERV08699.1 hypothetical protein Q072_04206 [Pseudomonas aeruginosa BL18]KSF89819.1 hypothetical protein AO938_17665 [Pseudomonas aeruginosa]KSH46677.1 hypothetical protein AO966_16555 [Pseudomonas aeruginosa]
MKQTFEYHVENIVIPYKTLTKGVAMFKHKEDTLEPDDHALLNPLRWAEVVRLGQEGEPAEFGKNRTLRFSGQP